MSVFFDKLIRLVLLAAVIYFLLLYFGFFKEDEVSRKNTSICDISKITVTSFNAGFDRAESEYLRGAATIYNGCTRPVGIQMKISSYDRNRNIVSVQDFWPANIDNIPVGEYSFSLDMKLRYDKRIESFRLSPVSITEWKLKTN
ncbi:hypothetical protein [Brenneria uluponensis]|uniref:hypothetical protein n=1 Tax=Brenneria uluponensis TaxID=3057057 RepID=UPI0028E3FFDE|nr:hypothetical protein [Brenneria ulupoensis]